MPCQETMRALLIVLDSVGVGAAPDAARYGDAGADTFGHILQRHPRLAVPTLRALGLNAILGQAAVESVQGSHGRMCPRSAGKDTTTGHWEIAGAILDEPFPVYDKFPDELVQAMELAGGVTFIGNYACSGTTVLEQLGAEHLKTGRPILYTSADSVVQIAAHEGVLPLERLYDVCRKVRAVCDDYRIGRVIARPFIGEPGNFKRTSNRHDYSMLPPPTVLNAIAERHLPVQGIGKISDIFAGSGVTSSVPTKSNAEGMTTIETIWDATTDGLVFANLVDFDMLFGHRRDVDGYARCLEEFDAWLAGFLPHCAPDDLLIITADHGNDPTFHGTDHTREEVPLFVGQGGAGRDLGTRATFADIAASLAAFFNLAPWPVGTSFLAE